MKKRHSTDLGASRRTKNALKRTEDSGKAKKRLKRWVLLQKALNQRAKAKTRHFSNILAFLKGLKCWSVPLNCFHTIFALFQATLPSKFPPKKFRGSTGTFFHFSFFPRFFLNFFIPQSKLIILFYYNLK